ncbi:MAG TPA: methylated-DNA--[protein]-cysteine S-methyltransferase [Opitutaceae bacterium]|nr:methylated-DNA--[protein]-cysteine S-methyltransferase [Opitutaceae bacterium]
MRIVFSTPLGRCALSWNANGVTGFELPEAADNTRKEALPPPGIALLIPRVQQHLAGNAQDFSDAPYDFAALPEFSRQVLLATLNVKSGRTATYGEIAAALGHPPSVSRAVGAALGANAWPLLIPCHRIVAANGKMTGFSGPGGVPTKVKLLAIEGAQLLAE